MTCGYLSQVVRSQHSAILTQTRLPPRHEILFVTANSSSGSKCYNLCDANEYRDGFQVDQCTVTTNTVELDAATVDKVELLRDNTAPVITDDCATLTTDDVEVAGVVDTPAPGEYTLTYRTADDAGNTTEIEHVVAEATTRVRNQRQNRAKNPLLDLAEMLQRVTLTEPVTTIRTPTLVVLVQVPILQVTVSASIPTTISKMSLTPIARTTVGSPRPGPTSAGLPPSVS